MRARLALPSAPPSARPRSSRLRLWPRPSAKAEAERKHAEQLAAQERAKELQAEQKAQRDARYLARKAKAQKRR